jgi:carbon monoxide dehydrogenase subunit G
MKLEGDYVFEASVAEVWSALFDPVILAAVMPGCEKLDLVDGQYVGDIKVKVGPIQGKFTGKVDLQDKVEPESYTMVVDGRGAPGFVKATAHVKLAAEGDGTRVHYDADAQIGGKIASVGQRLIDASARAIVAQSLEGLHTNIKLRAAAHREAAARQAAAAPPPQVEIAGHSESSANHAASAPAAADAAKPAAEGGEAAFSTEETVKTGAPSYIAVLNEDPTVRTARPTAPPASSADKPAAPDVAFTPVKVKQSALANAVAKEVASTLFPRSVLVAIIILEALVIVWLLLRH